MTTKPARHSHPVDEQGYIVPLPDPPRKLDRMQQFTHASNINLTLNAYFRELGRNDVLINGEGYLCVSPGTRSIRVVPDCVVAFGVDPEAITARIGYVINEVGKPPELVLEIGSASTGKRDYEVKPGIYAGFGVAEYWRFDHTGGEHHGVALSGDRLVEGEYFPIELSTTEDGVIWGRSEVLGLDVCWDNGRLRFYDPVASEYLLDYSELMAQRDAVIEALVNSESRTDAEAARADAAATRAEAEAARAGAATTRAEAEAARADAETQRADEAEAELRRLRQRLSGESAE